MQTYEIMVVQDSSIIMVYYGSDLVKSMEILSNLQSVMPKDVEIIVTTYEQGKQMFVNKTNGCRD